MHIRFAAPVAIVGFVVSASCSAFADDAKPSYKSLVSSGYEVKDVTLIPKDLLTDLSLTAPQVMVTLQKADMTAVCLIAAENWLTMNAASLEGTSQCDIH